MMKLEYEYVEPKEAAHIVHYALQWFIANISPCHLAVASGNDKDNERLSLIAHHIFEFEVTSEHFLMHHPKSRPLLYKGDGWAMVRLYRKISGVRPTIVMCYWFEDDAYAVQFKLAMQ